MNEEEVEIESRQSMEQSDRWHTPLTQVTPLSKYFAMALFVLLPFIGFWLGMECGKKADESSRPASSVAVQVVEEVKTQEQTDGSIRQVSTSTTISSNTSEVLTSWLPYDVEKQVGPNIMLDSRYSVGHTIIVRWEDEQHVAYWGSRVDVCLGGYDSDYVPMGAIQEQGSCLYIGGYTLGTTTLAVREYTWTIPTDVSTYFETPPSRYVLRLIVLDQLPSEGRSEWAGLIASLESNPFTIVY